MENAKRRLLLVLFQKVYSVCEAPFVNTYISFSLLLREPDFPDLVMYLYDFGTSEFNTFFYIVIHT